MPSTLSRAPECYFRGVLPEPSQRRLCDHCQVKGLSVCGGFADGYADKLAGLTQEIGCGAGSTLFREDDPAENYYTLTEGVLQFSKYLSSGRRQVLGFLLPGDFAGIAEGDHYFHTAEAITDCKLCQFPKVRFKNLMSQNPPLQQALFNAVSNELLEVEKRLIVLGYQRAEQRLAAFLLWYVERAAPNGIVQPSIKLPMTRRDIGDYLCLSLETVSRAFTKLRAQGVIELAGAQNLRILDFERLACLTED